MKKILISISLISTVSMMSCEKEKIHPSVNSQTILNETNITQINSNNFYVKEFTPENIGTIHNQCLDYAFKKLKEFHSLNTSSKTEGNKSDVQILKESTIEFLDNIITDKNYQEISNIYSIIGYSEDFGNGMRLKTEIEKENHRISLVSSYNIDKKELMRSVFSAIDNSNNIQELISNFEIIKTKGRNALTQQDYAQLVAVISVAQKSYEYWNANIDAWIQTLGGQTALAKTNVKAIIKADVEGAIEGAMAGTALGPGGWLTGAGIGAPLKSAWEGLWQAFQ